MKIKILQIFSRYLEPGGEERVTQLIETALTDRFHVDSYYGSTANLLGGSLMNRALAPVRAVHHGRVAQELDRLQAQHGYAAWLIHNVLPGLSPSVYATAFRRKVPVVHYLHNFRLMCTNGFLLNDGKPCTRCLSGNFWPAWETACWHGSRMASGVMGLVLRRIRHLRVFERVTAWVALNEQQKGMHVSVGVPADRIHVVPNFVERISMPPNPNPRGDVLFLGRLSREKGVDQILRAWSLVSSSGRRLLIAGSGAESAHLQSLAAELRLPNVEFLGPVPRERHFELWSRTAFSVMPSLWHEPFPLSMLEAWSNLRGFVAPRLGCFGENVRHGIDGLLYEPHSVEALAHALQQAMDDDSLITSMGRIGRARIETEFSREQWVERITRVLDGAIASV